MADDAGADLFVATPSASPRTVDVSGLGPVDLDRRAVRSPVPPWSAPDPVPSDEDAL